MSLSKKLFLIVCLLSLLTTTARAQYRFDYWTTDAGLPQNSVYSIAQTDDGYCFNSTLVQLKGR